MTKLQSYTVVLIKKIELGLYIQKSKVLIKGKSESGSSESYTFFANNMFTLLTCIISKNNVIVVIKFTCQP